MSDCESDKQENKDRQLDNSSDTKEKDYPGCCCFTEYPWWVVFILGNEFCERFAYYGMRSGIE